MNVSFEEQINVRIHVRQKFSTESSVLSNCVCGRIQLQTIATVHSLSLHFGQEISQRFYFLITDKGRQDINKGK